MVVLSNGTLFSGRRLAALEVLSGLPVKIQISLDRPDPEPNDEMRGPENFAKVIAADPGARRRAGSACGSPPRSRIRRPYDPDERDRLCALHRSLGVGDEDHVVRPIVHRGRAATNDLGVLAGFDDLEPELTLTADGAFASPFGPTVRGGRLDTDLLVTRTTAPLSVPADALARIAGPREGGRDSRLGIR